MFNKLRVIYGEEKRFFVMPRISKILKDSFISRYISIPKRPRLSSIVTSDERFASLLAWTIDFLYENGDISCGKSIYPTKISLF